MEKKLKEFDDVDLFNMEVNDPTTQVFDKPKKNQDGLYRPTLEDSKDKKVGYRSVIRFLPNFLENGKVGMAAIEKHIHYADFKNEPSLSGYYDCDKNFKDKCDLCTTFWKLKNSKNAAEQEKAKLISRQTKYYSYVLIVEDEQQPELVGKILVFPYGHTIKEKINAEKNGDVTGDSINVFDLTKGKDFVLIIKDKGGFANYDASQFKESSPIKLYDEDNKKFIKIPLDENGNIVDKAKDKVKKFLLSRTVKLEDFTPVELDEETRGKVADIINILAGNDISTAERKAKNPSKTKPVDDDLEDSNDEKELDDFFNEDE
jgi:hypothetical protein